MKIQARLLNIQFLLTTLKETPLVEKFTQLLTMEPLVSQLDIQLSITMLKVDFSEVKNRQMRGVMNMDAELAIH